MGSVSRANFLLFTVLINGYTLKRVQVQTYVLCLAAFIQTPDAYACVADQKPTLCAGCKKSVPPHFFPATLKMIALIVIAVAVIITIIVVLVIWANSGTNSVSNAPVVADNGLQILASDVKALVLNNSLMAQNIDLDDLGFYNLSVMKTDTGFSGVIRGCTWNGCRANNTPPVHSYPYAITLDHSGVALQMTELFPYSSPFDCCTAQTGNVFANGIEDPKIFTYHGEQWVVGNSLGSNGQEFPCVNTICLFKLSDPHGTFVLLQVPPDVNPKQQQKNWSPFEFDGKLYCEYSLQPHRILELDITTGKILSENITGDKVDNIVLGSSLRGGAPPIYVPHLKSYLGIGHTRPNNGSDYLHFFYSFAPAPPFELTAVSKLFKLGGTERIQFAAGISLHHTTIFVSYGVDDCFSRIEQLDISAVEALLKSTPS